MSIACGTSFFPQVHEEGTVTATENDNEVVLSCSDRSLSLQRFGCGLVG